MKIMKPARTLILILSQFLIIPVHAQGRVVSDLKITETGTHDEGRKDQNEIEACKFFVPNKTQLVNFSIWLKSQRRLARFFMSITLLVCLQG